MNDWIIMVNGKTYVEINYEILTYRKYGVVEVPNIHHTAQSI